LEHLRKVYSLQKKANAKRMFIIRKMTSQTDAEDARTRREEELLLKSTFSTKLAKMPQRKSEKIDEPKEEDIHYF
jgi:hypothetical protein